MSITSDTARIRRTGLRDQMDTFWNRLVDADPDPRRAYPRVRFDAGLTVSVGERRLDTRLYDISRGGVQIRCDRATAALIAPQGAAQRVSVDISVALFPAATDGGAEAEPAFSARCVPVHVTVLAGDPDSVALGLCFQSLEATAQGVLERFILRSLEPAPRA
jgi:hypothetical protein